MLPRMTILIVARDAGSTIARAVRSARAETACPLILVDDQSQDDTAARAQASAGSSLRLLSTSMPGGVGAARQLALSAVETEYAAWLDADDEWIAGRAARLTAMLDAGADVVTESIDLHDGVSGAWLRRLAVPEFLNVRGGAVRLFERNFLPGDTQVAFRTDLFRAAGGYDPAIRGPESFDVLLRALAQGARFAAGRAVGYRMFAYEGSVSRNLERQRAALAMALRKHDYEAVRGRYHAAGYPARTAAWALVMLAQFRGDGEQALQFLDEASPPDADPDEILEPDGPWPYAEGWRRAFHRGTILLQARRDPIGAERELARAETLLPTAETANNHGVALARMRRRGEARAAFTRATHRFPGYRDALINLAAMTPSCLTTHPLRRAASRSEYRVTA